jgi:hypothetical protein
VEHAVSPLSGWDNFYVIVGSGAAALIGLQFVVIALVWDIRHASSSKTIDAFATPTVVHFGAALLLSCIVIAPWPSLSSAAAALGICGGVGVGYTIVVIRRTRSQTDYTPVLEDWIWHTIVPTAAYVTLLTASIGLRGYTTLSLFAVAAVALSLLFTGIHNAWDTVTYIVIDMALQAPAQSDRGEQPKSSPG